MRDELHSFISDVLHRRGLEDRDSFALRSAEALSKLRTWDKTEIKSALGQVHTELYRRNSSWSRDQVLELVASRVMGRWPTYPENGDAVPDVITILFVASNPVIESSPGVTERPLSLDEEMREIQNKIRASKLRDSLRLEVRVAARPDDLIQAFNEVQPQIVHISGHGTDRDELVLQDNQGHPKTVSKEAIEALFKTMRDNIRVVVLNACFSEGQAISITKHVDCAIGMAKEIGDKAAIRFAASFYRAIGFGHSVERAFEESKTALMLEGIPEHLTPKLFFRRGVDPAKLKLMDA
jgi:hypothetical protein